MPRHHVTTYVEGDEVELGHNDAAVVFRNDGTVTVVHAPSHEPIVDPSSPMWQIGRLRMLFSNNEASNAMREQLDEMMKDALPPPMSRQ